MVKVRYVVTLFNLKDHVERITLSVETTKANAEYKRKEWRRALGGNKWQIDRRPGLDTLDHLAITIDRARIDDDVGSDPPIPDWDDPLPLD